MAALDKNDDRPNAQLARTLIQEYDKTVLSHRDRNVFMALMDQTEGKPNDALVAAAHRYKKQI